MIEDKLHIKGAKRLRLFDEQGVEIFEDDLEFIKNGKILYASIGLFFIFIFSHAKTVSNKIKNHLKLGEDFDRNSSLLEYEILEKLG